MPVVIYRDEPDANSFAIMGLVRRTMHATGRAAEWPAVQAEMMAGDYERLCEIAERETHGAIMVRERGCEE